MKPITVALPLGIGDAHWVCQKLQGLKDYHAGAPIHAFINESTNHKTVGYLAMLPFLDKVKMSKKAPYCITKEMPGTYRDPRYGTIEGCQDWNGFDYVMVANHWVEIGSPISDWLPELSTNYSFEYEYPKACQAKSRKLMPEPTVLLYLSGIEPNKGFHSNTWTTSHWVEVIRRLNTHGIEPLLVGAPTTDDIGYMSLVTKLLQDTKYKYQNAVGKTTIPDYVMLIERARGWMGLNSGGGIVAASAGTPTVMMWADSRWQVGSIDYEKRFCPGMQYSWLAPWQMDTYRPLQYGSLFLTPEQAVHAMMEVIRPGERHE